MDDDEWEDIDDSDTSLNSNEQKNDGLEIKIVSVHECEEEISVEPVIQFDGQSEEKSDEEPEVGEKVAKDSSDEKSDGQSDAESDTESDKEEPKERVDEKEQLEENQYERDVNASVNRIELLAKNVQTDPTSGNMLVLAREMTYFLNLTGLMPFDRQIRSNKMARLDEFDEFVKCPSCSETFESQFYLGEHFMSAHQSFEEMMALSNDVRNFVFPGFELLELINMIEFTIDGYPVDGSCFKRSHIYLKKVMDKKCTICCVNYTLPLQVENITISSTKSLDEMDWFEPKFKAKFFCCQQLTQKHHAKSTEKEQFDWNHIQRYPLTLTCCKTDICHVCLRQFLESKECGGQMKCMFCKFDHTFTGDNFIKIMEPAKFNKSWKKWWSDKLKIFY